MPRFLRYLKTQIIVAILVLTSLFAASAFYSMHAIERQYTDQVLLRLAGRLQFHQQNLTMQAMQYDENAPRDYAAYYRDLRLYFKNLKHSRKSLDSLIDAFANNDFGQVLDYEPHHPLPPSLPKRSEVFAIELAETWEAFSAKLDEQIGSNLEEPRLEWAAEWITSGNGDLKLATTKLLNSLETEVKHRTEQTQAINRLMLVFAVLISFGIMLWFYRRVLRPMTIAARGFDKVANGDFSHRVPNMRDNELGWMVGAFNRLSDRLETIHGLLTRLEQGDDLESTLRTLSETLPSLMPVDWIGMLVVGVDGRIHLEKAFSDGHPDTLGQQSFITDRTLLEECIRTRQPVHVADVVAMARLSKDYVFIRRLEERGRRDAILLPIGDGNRVQGVVVFASRYPNSYRTEHLELLQNIGVLLGVSLGRTVVLAENSRLANIGQFASGIVHEIRNPLATISMALEHLRDRIELPPGTGKRVMLANDEVSRLERLLSDILLYAKPLTLERQPADPCELLRSLVEGFENPSRFDTHIAPCPAAMIDPDRMRQVLINLLRNAEQAAPASETIKVVCHKPGETNWIIIQIENGGEAIPKRILDRIFEPFVTSKHDGTGLGLPIIKRITEAHGGDVSITSSPETGTRATLRIPLDSHSSVDQPAH